MYFSGPDRSRNGELHLALAEAGIEVALRAGSLRASPHLYNTDTDIDHLLELVG